jgi:hypothetical protein
MNVHLKQSILSILMALPLAAAATDHQAQLAGHDAERHSGGWNYAPLVRKVREVVFGLTHKDLKEYVGRTPCVSGPEFGAMGVHLINPKFMDGVLDVNTPEALIYEPQANGKLRLVGVEYIVPKPAWDLLHPDPLDRPSLEGHLLNLVNEPNRYGLPAFYEIHVWAFEDNPVGAFADWNTRVTCEKQRLP